MRAPAPRPRRFTFASAALAAVAIGLGAAAGPHAAAWLSHLSRAPAFQLEAIAVEGARRLAAADVARATGLLRGTPLADVEVAAVEARLAAHPAVVSARALRLPPRRVVVRVAERRAVGTAPVGPAGRPYLVCAEGVPFAEASPAEVERLPRLAPSTPLSVGVPNASLAAAAEVAAQLARAGFAVEEVGVPERADPYGPELRLRGGSGRVFLGWEDRGAVLARLSRLASRRPDLVAGASSIDLRFADRAVLRSDGAPEGASGGGAEPEGAEPQRSRPAG